MTRWRLACKMITEVVGRDQLGQEVQGGPLDHQSSLVATISGTESSRCNNKPNGKQSNTSISFSATKESFLSVRQFFRDCSAASKVPILTRVSVSYRTLQRWEWDSSLKEQQMENFDFWKPQHLNSMFNYFPWTDNFTKATERVQQSK